MQRISLLLFPISIRNELMYSSTQTGSARRGEKKKGEPADDLEEVLLVVYLPDERSDLTVRR